MGSNVYYEATWRELQDGSVGIDFKTISLKRYIMMRLHAGEFPVSLAVTQKQAERLGANGEGFVTGIDLSVLSKVMCESRMPVVQGPASVEIAMQTDMLAMGEARC